MLHERGRAFDLLFGGWDLRPRSFRQIKQVLSIHISSTALAIFLAKAAVADRSCNSLTDQYVLSKQEQLCKGSYFHSSIPCLRCRLSEGQRYEVPYEHMQRVH